MFYKGGINVGSTEAHTPDLFEECFSEKFREIFGEEPESPRRKRKTFQGGSGNYCWRQKGGAIIDMNDMSISHLKNAIRICDLTNNSGKADQLQEVLARKEAEEFDEDFDDEYLEDEYWVPPPGHPDEML